VDTELWKPAARRTESSDALRIVIVARLHRNKAHDVLLDALAELQRRGTPARLVIVGDGPERSALEEQVRRLGLDDAVEFTGSLGQEAIIQRMQAADVFALPSRFEPLGVAYMEAMSMEVATIGTTAGGVAEIIDDGRDGVLVPPDSPPHLADALLRLAGDPELRASMGKAGRHKIVTQFDSRIGAATLYERAFGRPPPQ
jgi:glycosyltransferase involved in cell wall biosynthesis